MKCFGCVKTTKTHWNVFWMKQTESRWLICLRCRHFHSQIKKIKPLNQLETTSKLGNQFVWSTLKQCHEHHAICHNDIDSRTLWTLHWGSFFCTTTWWQLQELEHLLWADWIINFCWWTEWNKSVKTGGNQTRDMSVDLISFLCSNDWNLHFASNQKDLQLAAAHHQQSVLETKKAAVWWNTCESLVVVCCF